MKKRFDKEDALRLLIIIGGILLICGWTVLFLVFPVLGIKEGIKLILGLVYNNYFIMIGLIGTLSAITLSSYFIYEYIIKRLEDKVTKKKLKIIKRSIWTVIVIMLIFLVLSICMILARIIPLIILAKAITVLFPIEVILIAVCLLLLTTDYANKKTKS